jgi:hypothetical protein
MYMGKRITSETGLKTIRGPGATLSRRDFRVPFAVRKFEPSAKWIYAPSRIPFNGEKRVKASGRTKRLILLLLLLGWGCAAGAQQDAREQVRKAVNSELAADAADHSHWIFYEVDRKPNNSVEQWVAQTGQGDVTRVLTRNGQPVPEAQQQQSIQAFIHDANAQAKQRQSGVRDDKQAEDLLKMLPDAFVWTVVSKNKQTTTYHFQPDSTFYPPTHAARVFAAMEGDMVVDNKQERIQELKGRLIYDVNFGYGLLGKLKAGGSFEVQRRETAPGIWQITESHIHIQGHELLFKTISEQEDDVKSNFQREPNDVTLEQAAGAVMKK